MTFRRDPHSEKFFEFRSSGRRPNDMDQSRGRTTRGFGYARRRDIDDTPSQQAAPQRGGRYDRTGEDGYARGLEEFEENRREDFEENRDYDRNYGRESQYGRGGGQAPWELDRGGVQFGRATGLQQREPGPHRGRGPKGYQRSDERIRDDVCDSLTEAHDVDATHIDVQVTGGMVTLTGTVDSRYEKRRAEDISEMVSGVKDVQNQLRAQQGAESR